MSKHYKTSFGQGITVHSNLLSKCSCSIYDKIWLLEACTTLIENLSLPLKFPVIQVNYKYKIFCFNICSNTQYRITFLLRYYLIYFSHLFRKSITLMTSILTRLFEPGHKKTRDTVSC